MDAKPVDTNRWIEENKNHFVPPICNKMMYELMSDPILFTDPICSDVRHNNQLKVFFVGGPNQRKDYHIEEGEEFFLMIKGDMCLKVIEKKKPKDVVIKEGQVFLLPRRIPHSPQRFKETIGLVVERERLTDELDALRYYVDHSTDILYERWFYCKDLGTQLVPIIKDFQSSDECKTGKPSKNSRLRPAPYADDTSRELMAPFALDDWLESYKEEINAKGFKSLFGNQYKSRINVYGGDKVHRIDTQFEIFFLQLRNGSQLKSESDWETLERGNTVLVGAKGAIGASLSLKTIVGGYTLAIEMPPKGL